MRPGQVLSGPDPDLIDGTPSKKDTHRGHRGSWGGGGGGMTPWGGGGGGVVP